MDINLDENERDLTKLICVKDKDGRIAVTVGLVCTVFLERPWERATKEAVSEVATRYISQFAEHLRYAEHPSSGKMYPITSKRIRPLREWLPIQPEGECGEFSVHGGETGEAASGFEASGFGTDVLRRGLGYFHVALPLLWFAEHSGTFQEFVLDICKRLKPLSGYANIGVIESPDNLAQDKFQPVVRAIAERFPGLEIDAPIEHALAVNKGIKGVSWLTILGERWINEMGGLDYLRMRLDEPSFPFYRYDGGLMIQAGPKPQIGDVKAGRWPQHYVTLARVLKKIQIKEHVPFHYGGPGRMDLDASMAWLFRFDGR